MTKYSDYKQRCIEDNWEDWEILPEQEYYDWLEYKEKIKNKKHKLSIFKKVGK